MKLNSKKNVIKYQYSDKCLKTHMGKKKNYKEVNLHGMVAVGEVMHVYPVSFLLTFTFENRMRKNKWKEVYL